MNELGEAKQAEAWTLQGAEAARPAGLPGPQPYMPLLRAPFALRSKLLGVGLALGLPLAAFGAEWVYWDLIGPVVWLLFYPAVIVTAVSGGFLGGAVATVISTALGVTLLLDRVGALTQLSVKQQITTAIFAGSGLAISAFAYRLRTRARESASRESNRRLSEVLEAAAEAVIVADDQGRHLYANRRAEELFGYPRQRLLTMRVADMAAPGAEGLVHADYERLRQQGRLRAEIELRRADGSVLPVEVNAARLPDGNYYGSFRDITERRRAAERQRLAAKVFESTIEGVLISDADNCIIAVNRAFCDITGYTEAEVIGRSPRMFQSGRHDEQFYRALWRSIDENGAWRGEIWDRRKSGEIYPTWMTINSVKDEAGRVVNYLSVFSDISDIKRFESRLLHLAHHDSLTGLPNRMLLADRLDQALARCKRNGEKLAVLFLDLDAFKQVNDALGHPAGDRLLQAVAERLLASVRAQDTVARQGGDEFVVLLEDVAGVEHVAAATEKVLHSFAAPFALDGREIFIGASAGVCVFPDDGEDNHTLLRNADAAMYQAKEGGRNTYRFYRHDLTVAARQHLDLAAALREAIRLEQFVLHYQPQVEVASGSIRAVEALVRWERPDAGTVLPGQFIPFAESSGLIIPMGRWILNAACAQLRAWLDEGMDPVRMAVNLSPLQFRSDDMVGQVRAALAAQRLPADLLEIEITEGAIMEQGVRAVDPLLALKLTGVRLVIDDFGTGYSSLSYLRRFPIDALKIDQSFMRDIPDDQGAVEIAATIITMAHNLGMRVVAEGVENEAQFAFVRSHGCDLYQGFHRSPALNAAAMGELLTRAAVRPAKR